MAILSKGTTYADGDPITSTNLNALVDSATFAAGAVESGGGLQLNGSSPAQLKVAGNIDIGTSNLTATGAISLGATTFNDNNITNVGSIAVDTIIADNTDVTIDAAGDIILDADGAQVRIKDGGTERFVFNLGTAAELDVIGDSVTIHSNTSDADIIFKGNDGGSTVTALTLDMSAAGAATFNDKITAVGTSVFTNLAISGNVDVDGTLETDALSIASTAVTSTAAELNILDGVTSSTAELNILDGVTSTAAEINLLDGSTANTVVNSKAVVYGSGGQVAVTSLSGVLANGVTATTQSAGDNSTKVATTAYVDSATGGGEGGSFTTLTASGDVNFDSGTFFTDASENRVGIGTTTPSAGLEVSATGVGLVVRNSNSSEVAGIATVRGQRSDTNTSAAAAGGMSLESFNTSGATVVNEHLGSVYFGANHTAGSESNILGTASIAGVAEGTFSNATTMPSGIAFRTGSTGQAVGVYNTNVGAAERMRIDSSGNVGIGTTSPSSTLDLTGTLAVSGDAAFDTDTLFVDVSADRVGINDSTPSVALDVTGEFNLTSHATLGSNLSLKKDTDAWSNDTWINASDYGVINHGGSFALTINGNGYRGTAGWTSFGKASSDGATQIWQYPQGYITFNANNSWGTTTDGSNKVVTERMRIDGVNGYVGIGEASPGVLLHVGTGSIYQNKTGSGAFPGTTDTTSHGFMAESQGAAGSTIHVSRTNSAAGIFARQGTGDVVLFNNTNSSVTEAGSIEITGATSVAYRTSSDYRLKENVVDVADGIDRVKQLNPVRFNFIGEDPVVDGFLAHEVQDIVPEAIGGTKDAMKDQEYEVSPAVYNEEGELVTESVIGTRSVPDYQGIDQSKLVPLLTAALQEAISKIESLEARMQTLEG